MRRPLWLLIADPYELFRKSLASALCQHGRFEAVGEAGSWEQMSGLLAAQGPGILVASLDLFDGEGPQRIRSLRDRFPDVKLLLLGRNDSEEQILEYLQSGAKGFLFRNQPLSDLLSSLELVERGEMACSPRVAHILFSRLGELGRERRRRERLDVLELTAREMEILHLMAGGLSNQEIAQRLFLSVHTVKNHVHKILETLGVPNRWAAVRHAFAKGWLQEGRRGS